MIIEEFQEKIDVFVSSRLKDYEVKKTSRKVIHDAVWGSNVYQPWEISILDSPLLQRLRDIRQTGFGFHTYPTAGHSRFEHTLGVIALAEKIANSLNSKEKGVITSQDLLNLRLAALLHDVGHCFFSHLSEMYYSKLPEFNKLFKEINNKYRLKPKGHEILSFLIIRSEAMRKLWNQIIEVYKEEIFLKDVDLNEIAEIVISYAKEPSRQYLADIINGPYDVDKLDYLARDTKFCGFSIGYDFERYLATIIVMSDKRSSKKKLFIPPSGINALEQIVINKLMLYGYIYHHQKVRICELMFKYVIHCIFTYSNPENSGLVILKHPCDFLNYTDSDFLNQYSISRLDPPEARKVLRNLSIRSIPKRALTISRMFIEGFDPGDSCEQNEKVILLQLGPISISWKLQAGPEDFRKKVSAGLNRFIELQDDWKGLLELGNEILGEIEEDKRGELKAEDIWIDIPKDPPIKEAEETSIPIGNAGDEFKSVQDFFPIGEWTEGYKNVKWKAHIYTRDEYIDTVRTASRKVLMRKYNLTLTNLADGHHSTTHFR
jgi:HD superfamily phosphohydrolase